MRKSGCFDVSQPAIYPLMAEMAEAFLTNGKSDRKDLKYNNIYIIYIIYNIYHNRGDILNYQI